MAQIDHLALWTRDLEQLRAFYETYFGARAGTQYVSAARPFASYFLTLESGARLELMQQPVLADPAGDEPRVGYAHLAITVGEPAQVDALTTRLRADGYRIASEPRWTGDGYYESVVLDPDGNRVELTALIH